MPALYAFGRRWHLGSDDLVYPVLLELTLRTCWLVALLVVYFIEVHQYACTNGDKIQTFYIGTMTVLGIYLFINAAIVMTSARGGIMETHARRHVSTLLYIKLAVFIPEVGWTILGTVWVFWLPHNCSLVAMNLAKSAVVIGWIMILCILLSIYVMFDPLGKRHVKQRSLKDYHQMWHGRCRFLCCCLRHDENRGDAFEEIAELLSNFFRGRDFVLTDTLAGVVLLSVQQKYDREMNPRPIVPISEAATLQIRTCHRTDYRITSLLSQKSSSEPSHQTDITVVLPSGPQPSTLPAHSWDYSQHPDPSRPSLPANTTGHSQDFRINPDHKLRSHSFAGHDTKRGKGDPVHGPGAARDTHKRHSDGENSVHAGLEDRFYVESEEKRLYDSQVSPVPDYGSSSNEDRESLRETPPGDQNTVKMRRHQKVAPPVNRSSVTSDRGSWMSSDSVFCTGCVPPTSPKPWMTLQNAAHYLRYSTAIYGSSNYGGCYNCADRVPLCRKYRWCDGSEHLSDEVLYGDNYWECEASSLMMYAYLDRDKIIYADLDNQIFKTPYFIARDDDKKKVVIAIRGTMSAGDALTDLTAHGQDIEAEHLPRGNVHKGVLKVARKMKQELENKVHLQDKIPKGYQLVITGHSLGAGVAAILSLLVRDQYPDVMCFSFSSPGGLVSLPLSIYLQDFVMNTFLGMDVVARLGVISMEKLKNDLLSVLKASRLPKYKILNTGLLAMCCGCIDADNSSLLHDTQTTKLPVDRSDSLSSDWEHIICMDDKDVLVTMDDSSDSQDVSGVMETGDVTIDSDIGGSDVATRGGDSTQSHMANTSWSSSRTESMESGGGTSEMKQVFTDTSYRSRDTRSRQKRIKDKQNAHSRNSSYPAKHRMSDSHAKWRKKQQKRKVGLAAVDPLYLPGQILYLYEDEELLTEGCCHTEPVYKARWAQVEEFDKIELHSKMMYHHNPYTVDEALQQILSQERYTPRVGSDSLVYQQPGRYAQPYDYDTETIDKLQRSGSTDSGIEEGLMRQSAEENMLRQSAEENMLRQSAEENMLRQSAEEAFKRSAEVCTVQASVSEAEVRSEHFGVSNAAFEDDEYEHAVVVDVEKDDSLGELLPLEAVPVSPTVTSETPTQERFRSSVHIHLDQANAPDSPCSVDIQPTTTHDTPCPDDVFSTLYHEYQLDPQLLFLETLPSDVILSDRPLLESSKEAMCDVVIPHTLKTSNELQVVDDSDEDTRAYSVRDIQSDVDDMSDDNNEHDLDRAPTEEVEIVGIPPSVESAPISDSDQIKHVEGFKSTCHEPLNEQHTIYDQGATLSPSQSLAELNMNQEPVSIGQAPTSSDEELGYVVKESSELEPISIYKESSSIDQEPVHALPDLGSHEQESMLSGQEPLSSVLESLPSEENSIKSEGEPMLCEKYAMQSHEPLPSEEDPIKFYEDPIKSEEDPITSEEDQVASASLPKPVSSLIEQIDSEADPLLSSHDPVPSVQDPIPSVHEPIPSVHEPIQSVQEPIPSVHEPILSVHEPIPSVHEPIQSVQEPIPSVHKPILSVQETIPSVQEPIPSVHEPIPSVHEPILSVQEPMSSIQEPILYVQEPIPPVQEPIPSVHESIESDELLMPQLAQEDSESIEPDVGGQAQNKTRFVPGLTSKEGDDDDLVYFTI